jgi:hypothetical protein
MRQVGEYGHQPWLVLRLQGGEVGGGARVLRRRGGEAGGGVGARVRRGVGARVRGGERATRGVGSTWVVDTTWVHAGGYNGRR